LQVFLVQHLDDALMTWWQSGVYGSRGQWLIVRCCVCFSAWRLPGHWQVQELTEAQHHWAKRRGSVCPHYQYVCNEISIL